MFAWSQTITTFYVLPFQRIHESKTAVTVYFQDDLFLMILGSSEKNIVQIDEIMCIYSHKNLLAEDI